jgi:hypothetical protein
MKMFGLTVIFKHTSLFYGNFYYFDTQPNCSFSIIALKNLSMSNALAYFTAGASMKKFKPFTPSLTIRFYTRPSLAMDKHSSLFCGGFNYEVIMCSKITLFVPDNFTLGLYAASQKTLIGQTL